MKDGENISIKDVIDLEIFLNFDKIVKMGHVGGTRLLGQKAGFYHYFRNILNAWKYRRLTLVGKIAVIKSLAASQLVYCYLLYVQMKKLLKKSIISSTRSSGIKKEIK